MSARYPIISVTGSSGAGTTSVKRTFEQIFRRENITAAFIEGDAFHRYDRDEMQAVMSREEMNGNRNFSHFGENANLLEELEGVFRSYSETQAPGRPDTMFMIMKSPFTIIAQSEALPIGKLYPGTTIFYFMKVCMARLKQTK